MFSPKSEPELVHHKMVSETGLKHQSVHSLYSKENSNHEDYLRIVPCLGDCLPGEQESSRSRVNSFKLT